MPLPGYQCPHSQRAPVNREILFFFLVQELRPASRVELRLHVQPHLPICLQGQGNGSVLSWLLLTGSSRFPSEFPWFCGLNQNLGAGRAPA